MIFFLGLLWAEEPAKVPVADQKVIHYLLDTDSTSDDGSVKKSSESFELPEKLQAEIEEQAKPQVQKTPSQPFPQLGAPWWWGLLFGALLLGGLRLFIGKQKKTLGSIKVHSRSFFGHDGSIAVVEVKDAEDNPRVFLLGMHSKGAPQFLADLSAPLPFPELGTPKERSVRASIMEDAVSERVPSQSTAVVEDSEEEEEKEALVEQILRMRETKAQSTVEPKESSGKRDRWTEGFHEVLRK